MSVVERIERFEPKSGDLFIITVRTMNDKRRLPLLVEQLQGLYQTWKAKGIDADVLVFDSHANLKQLSEEEKSELFNMLLAHKMTLDDVAAFIAGNVFAPEAAEVLKKAIDARTVPEEKKDGGE